MLSIAVCVLAYLLGSISFAIVVSSVMKLDDPRSYGSGNPGATNVLRSGNRKAAVLTLLGDALKGFVAVWITQGLGLDALAVAVAGFAVFAGHLWPIFFRLQGGKGVATAVGVLLAFDVWLGLACIATWLLIAATTRLSSLAALIAAALAPVFALFLLPSRQGVIVVALMSVLLIWKHKKNISGLLQGSESRIGQKKS